VSAKYHHRKGNIFKGISESVSFSKMHAFHGQKDILQNMPASNYTRDKRHVQGLYIYLKDALKNFIMLHQF
jgi:hypothetical protein